MLTDTPPIALQKLKFMSTTKLQFAYVPVTEVVPIADEVKMPPLRSDSAVVAFSGGQDSTTCLAWALSQFRRVHTIGFDYGQRHRVELQCRRDVLLRIGEF